MALFLCRKSHSLAEENIKWLREMFGVEKVVGGQGPFCMGNDAKEAVIRFGGGFYLVSEKIYVHIGTSPKEARYKLKAMGRLDNFSNF